MLKRIFFFSLLLCLCISLKAQTPTSEELKLYNLLMEYRASKGLSAIPLSRSLTTVAQTHVQDLQNYPPSGECNMHGWSPNGDWSSCCYTDDHAQAECMWSKPRELTAYQGVGYEIAFQVAWGGATAQSAMEGWKNSPGHNEVMINKGVWYDSQWKSVGCGIYGNYAVIWFGEEDDPAGYIARGEASAILTTVAPKQPSSATTTTATISKDQPINVTVIVNTDGSAQTYAQHATDTTFNHDASNNTINETEKLKLRERFYRFAGYNHISIVHGSFRYGIGEGEYTAGIGIAEFRTRLFGFSLFDFEKTFRPSGVGSWGYTPSIRAYLPVAKWMAISLRGGASVDMTKAFAFVRKSYEYDENNFYLSVLGGIDVTMYASRYVPIDIFAEYRHPLLGNTAVPGQQQGFYCGVKLGFGKSLDRDK